MTILNEKKIWEDAQACLGAQGMLSVIMPAYGLEAVIEQNIVQVYALLHTHIPFEIIPVDDGSQDATAAGIKRATNRDPEHIRPVFVAVNAGKGNALRCGFAASKGTHILLLDGDLDLSPHAITVFFSVMRKTAASIIVGSKRHPDSVIDYPWHRRLSSAIYYTLVRILVGLPVTDTQTGMKLFTREALAWSFERMLVKAFAFDLEVLSIAHKKGYAVAEAPIVMNFGEKVGCLSYNTVKQVMKDTLAVFYRLRILRYYDSVEVAPLPDKPIFVSIVIACPAPSDYLTECLTALETQTYRHFEVIVLPDGPATLNKRNYPLRIIPTGKTRPAEKRNLGIQEAKGEVVAFLDDDAFPISNWLEHAVKYFTLPDVGGVGGPGVTPPNDPFMAQISGRVYENICVSGNFRYRYAGDRVRASVDDYPSCNLLVRTDVLRAINGYNTRFWPGEDTILCADIVFKQNKRIVYDPWALVYHHRRPLFGPHLRQLGRYALHRGHFAKRFPQTSLKLSYLLPTFLVLGIVIGFPLAFLHPWLKAIYLGTLAFYALLTLFTSISLSPIVWLMTWLGVMASHVTYGVRFPLGLLMRRMPCEVAKFDHPVEKKTDTEVSYKT